MVGLRRKIYYPRGIFGILGNMKIIVYIKTGCPWCIAVTDFLDEKGIAYEKQNVTEDQALFEEMQMKSGQMKAPTLEIDGVIYGDSDVDELKRILLEKGVVL